MKIKISDRDKAGGGDDPVSAGDMNGVSNEDQGLETIETTSENISADDPSAVDQPASTSDGNSQSEADAQRDDRFLRLAADFENYKRQVNRREVDVRNRATRSVIEDLLPVLDNFERALDATRSSTDIESLRVGIEFIAQQFRDSLKNHGVAPIEASGQKFDPSLHDAVEQVSSPDHPEGTVVEEIQRGYSFGGQVMRPSKVRVAGK